MAGLHDFSRRLVLQGGLASGLATAVAGVPALAASAPRRRRGRREVAYICNSYGDTVSVLDVAAGRVIHTIALDYGTKKTIDRWPKGKATVSNTPMNAQLTPDGRQLWIPNTGGANIAVVDVSNNQIIRKIDTTYGPCDIGFTPDGRTAVFTLLDSGRKPGYLGILDVAGGSSDIRRVEVGPRPEEVALQPDGKRAFAIGSSLSLPVVDVATATVIRQVPVPSMCYDGLFSRDGQRLYLTSFGTPKLTVVQNDSDVSNIRVSETIDVDVPSNLAFSPDNKLIYVTSVVKDSFTVIDARTHKVLHVIKMPEKPSHIGVTSDGRTAYTGHSGGQGVTVVDLRKLEVKGTIPTGEGPSSITMAWI